MPRKLTSDEAKARVLSVLDELAGPAPEGEGRRARRAGSLMGALFPPGEGETGAATRESGGAAKPEHPGPAAPDTNN